MPWWFWIITHLWAMSAAGLFIGFLVSDEFEAEHWLAKTFLVFLCLIAPITILIGVVGSYCEEKYKWDDVKDKWFFKEMRKLKDRW